MIDAGPDLAASGFADALAQALDRNTRYLARTQITVLAAGKKSKPVKLTIGKIRDIDDHPERLAKAWRVAWAQGAR